MGAKTKYEYEVIEIKDISLQIGVNSMAVTELYKVRCVDAWNLRWYFFFFDI